MITPRIKHAIHLVGGGLSIIGLLFIAIKVFDYSKEIDFSGFDIGFWGVIGLLSILYGLLNLLLAFGWWNLLFHFKIKVPLFWATRTYGISHVAKYIPGNVFHFASRQGLGMAKDIPAWPLVKSSGWEIGLLSLSGLLLSILVIPLLFPSIKMAFVVVAFVAVTGAVVFILKQAFDDAVWHAFLLYLLFHALSGSIFVGIQALVSQSIPEPILSLMGAYTLAWLVGMLTPGAPAGIGVREFVLLAFFDTIIAEQELLIAIILGRIVTVLGDGLFYLLCTRLKDDA